MGIICREVITRKENGSIDQYGGTYELEESEAVAGIQSGKYRAIDLGDGELPGGVSKKKKTDKVDAVVEDVEQKENGSN